MTPETKELTVSCHCGVNNHTFSVPIASLPLPTNLCSCNISRRISGSLLTSYINITHPTSTNPKPLQPKTSSLTAYHSSSILTRYFCSTCGTHMYLEYHSDGHFEAATGTLQLDNTEGIISFKSQMWISDVPDGGASHFLTHIDNTPLPRWSQEPFQSHELPLPPLSRPTPDLATPPATTTKVHCHCNGVTFYITPPNPASYTTTSPFPDLTHPAHLNIASNPSNTPWWIPNPTHYLAGTCTCTTCRLISGFEITFWAFIPVSNIFLDGACTIPFRRNPYWGSMKQYRSSADVTRTFCTGCGANVFWDGDVRPGLVDVAVGLLDAGSGARAEEVLEWWTERVSYREEGTHGGLVRGLEEGLRVWGEGRAPDG